MKVTFTCEKCGHELSRESILARPGERVIVPEVLCPACHPPKLTYGPLTEEVVAEAVGEVTCEGPTYEDECRAVARFVLRLLDTSLAIGLRDRTDSNTMQPWRDWLLDLARKP